MTLAQSDWPADLVVAGDAALLASTAAALGLPLHLEAYDPSRAASSHRAGMLKVLHVPTARPVKAGELDPGNAAYVIEMLDRACDGCMNGEFAAMVTAPVQKSTLDGRRLCVHRAYGVPGRAHPRGIAGDDAANRQARHAARHARVALVTTHLPLADVPKAITPERLRATLRIVATDLERHFALNSPRIGVLGLNPHAGESGHLGREEIEVIGPVIEELTREGLDLRGPIPADTAFAPQFLSAVDVIVAMYHDQGLPVIKHDGFGNAVNVTLGLPILRTSVDHGTALSLARTGKADTGSLRAALALAVDLAGAGHGGS